MKIVHISLLGPFTDGWNYQDNLLTKYHRRLGYEVTILASTRAWNENGKIIEVPASTVINPEGIKIIRLETKKSRINARLNRFSGLYENLEAEKPDILFVHGCQMLDTWLIAKYLRIHRLCAYVDNHADFANSAQGWLSKNVLHKMLWRHSAQLLNPYIRKFYGVLPSRVDFLKDVYHVPAEKTELLVMGVDDELANAAAKPEVRTEIRSKYAISDSDFLIITGGKIDAAKISMLRLMQAVQNIPSENLKLIVFGSVAPELKDQIDQLNDGKKVQYIGWVDAKDTYSYFAAADLVCFPCLHSVFWEQAAGQGKPLLVRKMEGFQHVDLGGNTRFIEQDSVEAIQAAIENIISNPSVYKHMKQVAEEKGREVFSYLNIAKRSIEE